MLASFPSSLFLSLFFLSLRNLQLIVSSYATWPMSLKREDPFPGVICLCKAKSYIVISSLLNWLQMNKAKLVNSFLWGEFNQCRVEGQWWPGETLGRLFFFFKFWATMFYLVKITEFCQKLSSLFIFPISVRILKAVFNCI